MYEQNTRIALTQNEINHDVNRCFSPAMKKFERDIYLNSINVAIGASYQLSTEKPFCMRSLEIAPPIFR